MEFYFLVMCPQEHSSENTITGEDRGYFAFAVEGSFLEKANNWTAK